MFRTLVMGGWVMIPIAACSLLGLAIVIERCLALRRHAILDPRVLTLVETYDASTSPEQAIRVCRSAHGPFARIIEEVIKVRDLHPVQLIETMNATGRTQVGTLERGLTALEIVGNVSPLLGLLGTVLGLVTIFNAITAEGIGNAQVLSEGIAKALITTVAGLCVAIPAVACHSWLSRRVDDFATEMQERATGLIAKIQPGS